MTTGLGEGAYGTGYYGGGTAPVPPPPPPPDAGVVITPPARWTWVVGKWNGTPDKELYLADNQKITFSLLDHTVASFTVDGDGPEALFIADLNTDLWVYRDNIPMYRGRVIGSVDDIAATKYNLDVDTVDYRGLLERRILYADQVHQSKSPEFIVDYLISLTQGRLGSALSAGIVGGDWGINWFGGTPPVTGFVHDQIQFKAGDTVRQCIDSLAQTREGGFEWDIDIDKKLHLYYPRRSGVDLGTTLDLGGIIATANAKTDGTLYANALRQSGGTPTNQFTSTVTYNSGANSVIARLPDPYNNGIFVGTEVKITKGRGAGQIATVVSSSNPVQADGNPHLQLIVTPNWGTTPDTSSEIQVPRTPDPVNLQNLSPGDTPGGRFDVALGDTALTTQSQVNGRGNYNLEEYGTFRSSWTLTFARGGWQGPSHVWLGDVVTYSIKRGRRFDVRQSRVYEIAITIDKNGEETVSIVLGKPHDNDAKIIKRWGRRTAYLSLF